jgi:hypothetical protein
MSPYLEMLVSLGQWAQSHQVLVIAACVSMVFVCGGVRFVQRMSFFSDRRPRL